MDADDIYLIVAKQLITNANEYVTFASNVSVST